MRWLRIGALAHRLTVCGLNLERFINTMQKAGVPLLTVRRQDARTLVCECYSCDVRMLTHTAEEKGWRVSNSRPLRLSAAGAWLKSRPGILIGAALTVVLSAVLSQHIWLVRIDGAGAYRADIAAYLQQEGYAAGMRRADVDAVALESALMRRYPEVAWFRVYATHMMLTVEASQGVPAPSGLPAAAGDVVAQQGGVVQQVRVYAGTAAVKPGDVVQKGQTLIRGQERGADGAWNAVAAQGVVTARCWHSCKVRLPLYDVASEETGRQTVQMQLAWGGHGWPQARTPDYLAWNTYHEDTPLPGIFAPLVCRRVVMREVSMQYAPRDEAQVRIEACEAALERLQTTLSGHEMIDKWVDYCMIEGDTLVASATAELLVDIGNDTLP